MNAKLRELNQVTTVDCPHCKKDIHILLMGFKNPQYKCSCCDQAFKINTSSEIKDEQD